MLTLQHCCEHSRLLVGVDLDGPIALEDRDKYFEAKAAGISALRHYYINLGVNQTMVDGLREYKRKKPWVIFRIYTARKNDVPDIKDITHEWIVKHKLGDLFSDIVFTRWAWKIETVLDGCHILIDNDIIHLSRLPFIERIAYKPFFRDNKLPLLDCHIVL